MKDDHYREYDIPAGCMMIPNIWSVTHTSQEHFHQLTVRSRYRAMSRDPRYYPNPEEFIPERHLGIDTKTSDDYILPSSFVFGFGRR